MSRILMQALLLSMACTPMGAAAPTQVQVTGSRRDEPFRLGDPISPWSRVNTSASRAQSPGGRKRQAWKRAIRGGHRVTRRR